nr:tyrosine-protein phosphatase 10D-like [Parasteatoda tepidariorum]
MVKTLKGRSNLFTKIATTKNGIYVPEPITEIRAESVTDTDITLSWNRPPGEMDGYEIQYQDPVGHLIMNYIFPVPEPITEIRAESVTDTDITLSWNRPPGEMDGYEIQYQDPVGHLIMNVSFSESNTFRDLKPHHNYTFLVSVISGYDTATVRRSRLLSKTVQTHESVPGRVRFFRAVEVKPNEVVLQWTLPTTEQNGVLTGFKVTYFVKGTSKRRYEYFEPTETRGLISGLIPGMEYVFEIQAHTKVGPGITTVSEEATPIWDNQTLLAGNLVPLVLLVLVVGVALFWKRRRLVFFSKKTKHGKADTMSVADCEVVTNRPVKLKDFADHYRIMSADSDFRFSEEFELLKNIGRDKPCNAADLPVNRPKNRFTNILPYDHSRIKLMPTDDEEGTDYINANYIPGYNSPREFIVTQGPLHSTRDDLWRMIWEQNCRAIVMLTRCIEKGREECDHYWPFDMQPVYYGDIQVILLNESQYSHWTISEFKVSRNEQSRILKHFHFTTWPDFGVPEPAQVLVKFVRTFRERIGYDPKPIVVHCR